MAIPNLKPVLRRLLDYGEISVLDDAYPSFNYSPHAVPSVMRYIEDNLKTMHDRHVLLHEVILAHGNGQQFTDDETLLFLMDCAYGHSTLRSQFELAIRRELATKYEEWMLEEDRETRRHKNEDY